MSNVKMLLSTLNDLFSFPYEHEYMTSIVFSCAWNNKWPKKQANFVLFCVTYLSAEKLPKTKEQDAKM